MPFLDVPGGQIHYEEHGSGYPVLLFAPGFSARASSAGAATLPNQGRRRIGSTRSRCSRRISG